MLTNPIDSSNWDELISQLPNPHLLQTWEWASVKQVFGWQSLPQWIQPPEQPPAAALVLQRTVSPLKLRVLYAPRGPLLDWTNSTLRAFVFDHLQRLARNQKAILIKIDPEIELGRGLPSTESDQPNPLGAVIQNELIRRGWRYSSDQIQFRNSVWLDLTGSQTDWLERMKPKTRYNIRLSQKKGVQVRVGGADDLPLLYRMYAQTSLRDGFVIRSQDYYQTAWGTFIQKGMAEPLIAEVDGAPIAGLILFFFAGRAWYLHGMSLDLHRDKMPNYLLQWQAMLRAKFHGCLTYDLWGAPEVFDESDSMWGVFRFKEGLGGSVVRTLGAWDFPTNPVLYELYTRLLPQLLKLMRNHGKSRTRQEFSA